MDPGFDRDPMLVASVNAQRAQLEPAARPALFRRALEAAAGVPGVASAAAVGGDAGQRQHLEQPHRAARTARALPENERITYINLVSDRLVPDATARR